jgi:hypothetical protein
MDGFHSSLGGGRLGVDRLFFDSRPSRHFDPMTFGRRVYVVLVSTYRPPKGGMKISGVLSFLPLALDKYVCCRMRNRLRGGNMFVGLIACLGKIFPWG